MIIARLKNGNWVIGIDASNVRKLKEGQTMVAKLSELGGDGDVAVIYGDELKDVVAELERATGAKLPPPSALPESQGRH